ncbi:MAG: ATP-binding protein [Microthrixaceae bacterium]
MTRRLLLSYMTVTVVVLAVLMVPLGIFYAQRERDRFTSDVERDAGVLATIYEDALELELSPNSRPADEYRKLTGARVVVVDRNGISLIDTRGPVDRDFSTRPEIRTALAGSISEGIRTSETLGTSLLYVAVPVASSGINHGAVRVTLDADRVDARINRFWTGLGAMAVIILLVAALVGWALAQSLARPIRLLNATAARYARGDLSNSGDPPGGPVEIRELSATMTNMAERLQELLQEQREFVADASHQLRTPLTALRLRLENLQTRVTPAEAAELDVIIGESSRLTELVSDLLQLARADQLPPPVTVDLAAAVAERVEMWSAVADDREVHLVLESSIGPYNARAVPGAAEQILDNLLDNAIKASPPGSTVTVTLATGLAGSTGLAGGGGEYQVSVSDEGHGLSDEDKLRATRRFWRGDATTPGTGLGLAIVLALVVASGGHLELSDVAPHGLTVTFSLPAALDNESTPAT